jgi:hypothetical protein
MYQDLHEFIARVDALAVLRRTTGADPRFASPRSPPACPATMALAAIWD